MSGKQTHLASCPTCERPLASGEGDRHLPSAGGQRRHSVEGANQPAASWRPARAVTWAITNGRVDAADPRTHHRRALCRSPSVRLRVRRSFEVCRREGSAELVRRRALELTPTATPMPLEPVFAGPRRIVLEEETRCRRPELGLAPGPHDDTIAPRRKARPTTRVTRSRRVQWRGSAALAMKTTTTTADDERRGRRRQMTRTAGIDTTLDGDAPLEDDDDRRRR